mmetsp:Transcript_15688/g.49354  ORF Transcript_15688/g.49354 Transcript_15688/m.49354 type:complete len:272 (-) Transcript_15688:1479-2294(-)
MLQLRLLLLLLWLLRLLWHPVTCHLWVTVRRHSSWILTIAPRLAIGNWHGPRRHGHGNPSALAAAPMVVASRGDHGHLEDHEDLLVTCYWHLAHLAIRVGHHRAHCALTPHAGHANAGTEQPTPKGGPRGRWPGQLHRASPTPLKTVGRVRDAASKGWASEAKGEKQRGRPGGGGQGRAMPEQPQKPCPIAMCRFMGAKTQKCEARVCTSFSMFSSRQMHANNLWSSGCGRSHLGRFWCTCSNNPFASAALGIRAQRPTTYILPSSSTCFR